MKNRIKIVFSILIIMVSLSSCRFYLLAYKTLELKTPNPTSYVFHTPMDSVLSLLNAWKANPNISMESYDNPIKEIYKDYESHDYYCIISRLDQAVSPVHLNKMGGGIRLYTEHRALACDSITPFETRISVIYSQSKLVRGNGYMMICPRGSYLHKTIPSSTILEYRLLRFIGDKLGERNMTPICYPKGLDENNFKGLMRHLRF